MKVLLLLIFSFASCASIPVSERDLSFKLQKTRWATRGFVNKRYANFDEDTLRFQTGRVLGTQDLTYKIVRDTPDMVVYCMYSDTEHAGLLGVVQTGRRKIKLLYWNALWNEQLDSNAVENEILDKGMEFTILRRLL